MKKLICVFLVIAILLSGCQRTPVDNSSTKEPAVSATPDSTPSETIIEVKPTEDTSTSENVATETVSPSQEGASTATSATTPTQTTTPTQITTPTQTATPAPTPTPETKTFSIAITVAGGAKANSTKLNFKGYYKNGDENSGVVVVAQNGTASFTVTGTNSNWQYSDEYSTYAKDIMKVTTSGTTATVTITLKVGIELTKKEASGAHFVYVPKATVNNGIPTMLINVETNADYYNLTQSTDKAVKDIWSQASYAIVEGTKKTYDTTKEQGTLKIKRRGYSSFDFDKKSYTLKLDDGKALLGMNKNRDWVLAANYSDKSLLRNYFAYNISKKMNTSWASDCDFVDVYLTYGSTSNYLGTFLLVEKIEAAEDKINITEMTAEDTSIGAVSINSSITKALAGSFVVELESFDRASTGDMLITSYNAADNDDGGKYQMSVKSPDKDLFVPSTEFDPSKGWSWPNTHLATKNTNLADYIRTFFITVDDAIDTDNYAEFSKYIDVDSFVDYYILNELAKNVDGNFRLSTYFYKDKGGKLKITVWDFDIAFGNCNYNSDDRGGNCGDVTGFYIRTHTSWFKHMLRTTEFQNKVKTRWKELRKGILSDSNMESMLTKQGSVLQKAADANFRRWPILGVEVWPNSWEIVNCDTYEEHVQQLISWLQRRAAWLDRNI